ncbi:uncharacterized protein LOC129917089 [Episyrphus balteatus]|uniref:uncharacterized protein LOC129917089 n=1 Tax=Episyrphus balteatus TaxID=286459 RepID=UPI002486B7B4|nr:uncharacterized protein LOC129917089 [Episyrphus balteatus]
MKSLCLLWTFFTCTVVIYALPVDYSQGTSISRPKPGSPLDEVIVESSLHIKNKKTQARRTRDTESLIAKDLTGIRVKREPRRRHPQNNDSSQSSANAAANGNYFGSDGFGASAAQAQAQGFYSGGKLGGFGANAANTQTQSFNIGPDGLHATAGGSLSQVYNLPNGKTINVNFANNFATGADGDADSKASAINWS